MSNLNPTSKTAKYLNWALKGVLYLILITPVLLNPRLMFPFITTKTMFFRLAVELAVLLYLALVMLNPRYRPKMNKLSWAIVIFGIIILITGITGVDFYKTFWGTIERGEGFLTLSHLIIYFLLLSWTLKTKKEWFNYLTGVIIVGLLVNFHALLQKRGVEEFPIFGRIIHAGEDRLSATIGNAAFMGAYTLSQFFINLLLFLKRKKWWKILFGFGILANFYILYQTQTRGALLAWLIVMLALTIIYALKSPHRLKKIISLGILGIIIASSLIIWFNRHSDWVKNNNTLYRLVSISTSDITTEARLSAWRASWSGWKDRFILGYGWENYNVAYNKHFPPEIYKDAGSQLWFDRAHNTIFDVAVATGIFGLINYIVIFGLALYYLFKKIKKDFDLCLILIALLVAHFLQNIFVFDVLVNYITLFLIFALISVYATPHRLKPETEENKKISFNYIAFISATIIVIFFAYIFNLKPLKANSQSIQGLILAANGQITPSLNEFQKAIDMKTYQTPEIRQKLADNLITSNTAQNAGNDKQACENFEIGIQEIEKNLQEHPLNVQNHLYLMALKNKAGRCNTQYFSDVIKIGQSALELSPTRPQIYFEMGQAAIFLNKIEEGLNYFKQGIALNPDTVESLWTLLGAYVVIGDKENADKTYNLMLDKGYKFDNSNRLNRLYNVYRAVNDLEKMAETLEQLISIQPTGSNYARLAAVYAELKQYDKARIAVQKAVEFDPSLATEAQKFLQLLDSAQAQ